MSPLGTALRYPATAMIEYVAVGFFPTSSIATVGFIPLTTACPLPRATNTELVSLSAFSSNTSRMSFPLVSAQ